MDFGEAVIEGFGGFFQEEGLLLFIDADNRFHDFHVQQREDIVFLEGNHIEIELIASPVVHIRKTSGGLKCAYQLGAAFHEEFSMALLEGGGGFFVEAEHRIHRIEILAGAPVSQQIHRPLELLQRTVGLAGSSVEIPQGDEIVDAPRFSGGGFLTEAQCVLGMIRGDKIRHAPVSLSVSGAPGQALQNGLGVPGSRSSQIDIRLSPKGLGMIRDTLENMIQAPQSLLPSSQLHERKSRSDANVRIGRMVVNLPVQLLQCPFEFPTLPVTVRQVQRRLNMIGLFP